MTSFATTLFYRASSFQVSSQPNFPFARFLVTCFFVPRFFLTSFFVPRFLVLHFLLTRFFSFTFRRILPFPRTSSPKSFVRNDLLSSIMRHNGQDETNGPSFDRDRERAGEIRNITREESRSGSSGGPFVWTQPFGRNILGRRVLRRNHFGEEVCGKRSMGRKVGSKKRSTKKLRTRKLRAKKLFSKKARL